MSEQRIKMPMRYLINTVLVVLLGAVLVGMVSLGILDSYWEGILIVVGINIILATSLNIPVGYLGQLPLGHAGFMAIGAYTAGIFLRQNGIAKLLRSGLTPMGIVYLILGLIIRVVLTNIDDAIGINLTYGAAGLKRIPKFTSLMLVYLCVVLTIFLIHVFMKSRHGRAVLSIRENEIAAESVGINTTFYKTYAFSFSAALAGLAGALYAGYLGSLYPASFNFMKSIEVLVMVVLGGMGSMLGSILSASLYTILQELLRSFESYRMVAFALLLILMMIFRPKGLLGDYDFSLSRLLEKVFYRGSGSSEPEQALKSKSNQTPAPEPNQALKSEPNQAPQPEPAQPLKSEPEQTTKGGE